MQPAALIIGFVAVALAGNVAGQEDQSACGDFDYREQAQQLVIPSQIIEDLGRCDVRVINAIIDGNLILDSEGGEITIEHGLTLENVSIRGDANFDGATIEGDAFFSGTTFEGAATLRVQRWYITL